MAKEYITSQASENTEIQRLLENASRQPWGPGREIDAKVTQLHQELLSIVSRLGSPQEQPEDAARAHELDHQLRNKLTVFRYYDDIRRLPPLEK